MGVHVCVCVHVFVRVRLGVGELWCVHTHIQGYPQRPEEGMRSPGAVVTGNSELPNMDARNQTNPIL